jgi:hypothetical protein
VSVKIIKNDGFAPKSAPELGGGTWSALPGIKYSFRFFLLLIALKVTFDHVKSLVILGRRRLAAERSGHRPD